MTKLVMITLLSTLISCSPDTSTQQGSDDYVLIEFAARLEEDYQRLYPEQNQNRSVQNQAN